MPNSTSDLREIIRDRAIAEGFDVARFTRAEAPPDATGRLQAFLGQGRHGTMDWMVRNADRRGDPQRLWPDAKSILMLGINYGPDHDPLETLTRKDNATVSVYAQGSDYHDVIKTKLKRVAGWVAQEFSTGVKVFIDTAPVLEKPLAHAAGLGWQGKHTNLVSRHFGSWLFLGSVFIAIEIEPDIAESDHCGQCHACLDICPTNAFPAPYQLDARRCISYLTIEHKGHIAREFREAIGNRIYGCDDCLAICPWNKFASLSRETKFHARAELRNARLADLARMDDAKFREFFKGSPIKRVGRDRFVRNVLIAIGNSSDTALATVAEGLLSDPSPLVRAMAIWALSRLLSEDLFSKLALRNSPHETDENVCKEWVHPSMALLSQ
ncbi:MAG TPA: tRNA epoxyqueuosine(34) reductase QueG [Rhizomicrobium sp.]|jgi:epoxyqueuosine reductase|nr:tRNA epoxyqueuosine(34) reductase QueG [Rhizomicrobium sp.]